MLSRLRSSTVKLRIKTGLTLRVPPAALTSCIEMEGKAETFSSSKAWVVVRRSSTMTRTETLKSFSPVAGQFADGTIAGSSGALFRNEGALQFTNVNKIAALDTAGDYSHGCFVSDFDCDGFPDIFVTAFGQCRLFHNEGDGCFHDHPASALVQNEGWWTGAAWGDIDRDGFPDLFVTGYLDWSPETDRPCWNGDGAREVCGPGSFHLQMIAFTGIVETALSKTFQIMWA